VIPSAVTVTDVVVIPSAVTVTDVVVIPSAGRLNCSCLPNGYRGLRFESLRSLSLGEIAAETWSSLYYWRTLSLAKFIRRTGGMILTEEAEVLRNKSVPLALCPSQTGLGSNCRLRGERRDTRRSPQCPR